MVKVTVCSFSFGAPFALTRQDGQPITEQAFRGKPTALFFGFTHCPEVCPTTLFELDGWLKTVDPDAKGLQAYFVTVDPERDTPEILGRYISNVTDRVKGIAGEPAKIGPGRETRVALSAQRRSCCALVKTKCVR